MDGLEIVRAVESSGGAIWADGDFVGYRIPKSAAGIITQIRDRKTEVLKVLRDRPPSVRGVRVLRWDPVDYPVKINRLDQRNRCQEVRGKLLAASRIC